MEDMLQEIRKKVSAIAGLLQEHNGQDVCLMDIHEINNWTDFFIIATASSTTHIEGMVRHLKEHCRNNGIEILGSSRKEPEDEWRLIDLGYAVVHIMTKETREFYDLERLWQISGQLAVSS